MKKTSALAIVLAIALFSSCEKEQQRSYMPTWKGFSYTPKPTHRGDTLTVTAQQASIGHLIYKAQYTWVAKCPCSKEGSAETFDSTYTCVQTVVYDNNPVDPTMKYPVPTTMAGTRLNISFTALYYYSATGVLETDGSIYTEAGGTLRQQQSSSLYGKSTGSLAVTVTN